MPLIVILTENFLKTVFSSSEKSQVIDCITKYTCGQCVHVWAPSVDIAMVKKYSIALVNTTAHFRRVSLEEIRKLPKKTIGRQLQASLHDQTISHRLDPAYTEHAPLISTDSIDEYAFRMNRTVSRTDLYVFREAGREEKWKKDGIKELVLLTN